MHEIVKKYLVHASHVRGNIYEISTLEHVNWTIFASQWIVRLPDGVKKSNTAFANLEILKQQLDNISHFFFISRLVESEESSWDFSAYLASFT